MATPKIAVAGKAPYRGLQPRLDLLLDQHGIEVEFEMMNVANPSLEFMIDTLEYLAKAGVVAIDIWHPNVQIVTSATEWSQSAERAGSADFLTMPGIDSSIPSGHNLSFEATLRSMKPEDVEGVKVAVITDRIPAGGIRAGLLTHGARDVTVIDPNGVATTPDRVADLTLDLSPQAMEGRDNVGNGGSTKGLAQRWLAARFVAALEHGLNIETSVAFREESIDVFQRDS